MRMFYDDNRPCFTTENRLDRLSEHKALCVWSALLSNAILICVSWVHLLTLHTYIECNINDV